MTEEERKEYIKKLEKDLNEYKSTLGDMNTRYFNQLKDKEDLKKDNTRLIKIIDKLLEKP